MERLGVLMRQRCVVRNEILTEWDCPGSGWGDPENDRGHDEWAIIDGNGEIIDGPHKFEVEVAE